MIIDRDFGIPLPDGTRLSAKLWMPDSAKTEPVPAIIEYLPYRKTDGTAARDDTMHPWFAARGYACLRVDRRGCGDSEGLYDDEYSEQELQDGVDLIHWIAAQPWCTGRIGMQGISWGGFNGVQIAARAPEPLKAVISIGTTADRYHDDIHYKGGIQVGENIGWAATAMSWFSTPPDPELMGGNTWRDTWLSRLENTPFVAERWTRHSDRDAYWKHGSICESYDTIKASVLVMGGLHDGYRNAMAAMVEGIDAPVQGILGPWGHKYPHISHIAPAIDYLNVALRWWDRWLKQMDNGAETDPAYRAYVMDSVRPDPALDARPGQWIAESSWPSPDIRIEALPLGKDVLGQESPFSALLETDMACGRAFGEFFPFGFGPGELPDDQTHDDDLSACFDTDILTEDQIILGAPEISLRLSADKPRAQIAVRLCDIRPDGTSNLITLGLLNLRHREGFETKTDLVPGETIYISLKLDQTAYRLPAGHRLRLAVSGSYWPFCWPEGEAFTLTLTGGALNLPLRQGEMTNWAFDPPIPTPARKFRELKGGREHKAWHDNPDTGDISLEIIGEHARLEDEQTGIITESAVHEQWNITRNDPASAKVTMVWTRSFGRGDWEVRTRVTARMAGQRDAFVIDQRLEAWEGATPVFDKSWHAKVPR